VAVADGVCLDGRIIRPEGEEKADRPHDFGTPFNLSNHPVVGVTWYEALAYCAWLTEQLCRSGVLQTEAEITLPTEQQWEKAARGTEGWEYPWGNQPDPNRANYSDTQIGATSAVGCFSAGASVYDCQDMSGNVWEWCLTKYETPKDNGSAGGTNIRRVLRGGVFLNYERSIRCAVRDGDLPVNRNNDLGFRVCLALLPR
jgi:formylglycine-generating enzyme required for sulfatase activity